MRRVVGLTLTGLGAFFVAAALLLRFYVADQVIKFPLNEYVVLTFTGNGLSYFSVAQLKEVSGVSMRATSTFRGDVKAGSSSVAVWDNFTALEDVTNHQPIEYSSQRAAFDRRTGALQQLLRRRCRLEHEGAPVRPGLRVADRHAEADLPGVRHHPPEASAGPVRRHDGG